MSERHPEFGPVPLSNALDKLLYEVKAQGEGREFLRGHPGRALDVLTIGNDRLLIHPILLAHPERHEEVVEAMRATYERAQVLCDSPIERNLLAALVTGCWSFSQSVLPLIHDIKNADEPFPDGDVVIVPQLTVGRHRLDFGIVVWVKGVPRIVGVECDGAEFHQDRDRDIKRDEHLRRLGVPVLRYPGHMLHNQPIAVADAIIHAITEWRG